MARRTTVRDLHVNRENTVNSLRILSHRCRFFFLFVLTVTRSFIQVLLRANGKKGYPLRRRAERKSSFLAVARFNALNTRRVRVELSPG